MVNKFLRFKYFAIVVGLLVAVLIIMSPSRDLEDPKPKVVLEMNMIPVDDSPGEYILEYSNGSRELLKKNGTRMVIAPKEAK
jgi:hypothetical protein